jgi:hypothetical protein
MEQEQTFNERAKVAFAVTGRRGRRVHYSPRNDETLCGRFIERYVGLEDAVALFDKGHELCIPCHRAAEKRAEALRLAAESPVAAAAVALAETVEQVDAESTSAEQDAEPRYKVEEFGPDTAGAWDTYTVDWSIEETTRDEAEETAARLNRENAEARAAGPIAFRFYSTREAYDATQTNDHIRDGDVLVIEREQVVGFLVSAWPAAVTSVHGELHGFTTDPRTIDDGKYAASVDLAEQIARKLGAPLGAEQPVVEGVVVEHAGTAQGSKPSDATHTDVIAACAALANLKPATLTEHHDVSEPTEDELDVRGYVVDPRGGGRVAVYWLEGGRIVRHDDAWHGPSLDCLADRLTRSGWAVEKTLRSSLCVFAHRPDDEQQDVEAPAAIEAGEQDTAVPADDASSDETCLHHVQPRQDVSGDPITSCARKQPNQSAGVFNDEGCIEAYDCCVQAANEAARLNAEEGEPGDEPLCGWDLMCPQHQDEQVDACEECNAVPVEDRCPECSGKGCHGCHWTGEKQTEGDAGGQAVDDEADGTWRSGWIKAEQAPAGDALFDLGADVEQGALFE